MSFLKWIPELFARLLRWREDRKVTSEVRNDELISEQLEGTNGGLDRAQRSVRSRRAKARLARDK